MNADLTLPQWDGWHLIGRYASDVGSWLLHHGGEAVLLEVPEGLPVAHVKRALRGLGAKLLHVTASHDHEDHLDVDAWSALAKAFPKADLIHPSSVSGDQRLNVGGEALWLIKAPKHSATDVVTVFRGVAMTGDIELGMLRSVNNEVRWPTRLRSMDWLRGFQDRAGYRVHTTVSAHLNDVRTNVNWPDLFSVQVQRRDANALPTPRHR